MPNTRSLLEQAWVRLHFCEDPTGPSRRIVSIFLDVVLSQIAAPYTRGSFADAEVDADQDFGLAQVFSQGFEIAIDGRAFFENMGITEANRYFARLDTRIESFSNRHDHAAPIGIAAVDRGLH